MCVTNMKTYAREEVQLAVYNESTTVWQSPATLVQFTLRFLRSALVELLQTEV